MVNVTYWFKRIAIIPFFWLLACGLMLPSDGNHGLMSPKSLSFLLTSMTIFGYFFLYGRFSNYQYRLISFTSVTLAILFSYLFLAMAYDQLSFPMALDQFKLFVITWVFAVVTLYLISDGALKGSTFLRAAILFNCAFSSIKVFAVIFHVLGLIKLWDLMKLTGMRFMSLHVTDSFARLQTSVDIVTPYFIYFVLLNQLFGLGFKKTFRGYYLVISILSVVLSFSRFLLAVAIVSFFLYWLMLNIPKMTKAFIIAILMMIGMIGMVGMDTAEKAFHMRFTSLSNYQSDATRHEQVEALLADHDQYQLIGKGLGGSASNYLRDDSLTHSYEVQWVAFLMQLGVLGIMLLFIPVCYICSTILTTPIDSSKIGLFCLFGIWLLSGFTNPYLISLTSGIVYACFIVAGDILGKKWRTPEVASTELIPLKNT